MHPLEQLRFVARGWESTGDLPVEELAAVLCELAAESPSSLLQACRRLIERFPASGRLWWLSARALSAPDPVAGIWEAAGELMDDPTAEHLLAALPPGAAVELVGPAPSAIARLLARRRAPKGPGATSGGRAEARRGAAGRVDIFPVLAAGPAGLLLDKATAGLLNASSGGQKVDWAVLPRGAVLPGPLWEQVLSRVGPGMVVVAPGEFAALVGPAGAAGAAELLAAPGCPPVAELLGWPRGS